MTAHAVPGTNNQDFRLERWLRVLLAACLVAILGLFAFTTLASLLFSYGLNYGEGLLIDQVERILAGQTLYKVVVDEPPYMIDIYPPLYPLLLAGFRAMTGLPLLQLGRAISLLAGLVSGLIIGLLAYGLSGRRFAGVLATILFLGNPFVIHWSSLVRVDLTALALSLVALWLLYSHWRSWPWLGVAILCLLAAIYTRQTYALAVPLAGVIWLWHNDRRRALIFIATLALGSLALFILLNAFSEGGFYLSTVQANMGRYRITRVFYFGALLLLSWPVVVVLAGTEIGQIVGLILARGDRQDVNLAGQPFLRFGLFPYTFGATVALLTVGKLGSDINYLLELMAALAVWSAGSLVWQPRRGTIRRRSMWLLAAGQVLWILVVGLWLQSQIVARWRDLAQYDDLYQEVQAAARHGPVLTDDYTDLVVLAGQRVYLEPHVYQQLEAAGLWEPMGLIAEIEAQKFPLIVLREPGSPLFAERWSPPMVAAIEENYEATEPIPGIVVYKPQGGGGVP